MIILKDFLEIINEKLIYLYCPDTFLPSNEIDTQKYEVIDFGKEAAEECPEMVWNECFYIKVKEI